MPKGYHKRRNYSSATEIGIRLTMSNETLDYIKRVDPELYKRIMPEESE